MMMSAVRRKAPQSDDLLIGARVRARRLMIHMTLEQLAERIGVTFQQVQKYEKGANRISGSRLKQICAALECQPDHLFGGSNGGGIDVAAQLLDRRDSRQLLEAFRRVTDTAQRSALVVMVQSLARKDEIKCAGLVAAAAILAASLCFGCLMEWTHQH